MGRGLIEVAGGRFVRAACLVVWLAIMAVGCEPQQAPDTGAHQSLVEIGERSLEVGEALESQGRRDQANVAYRRSLWAFRYHQNLTSEQPLLLDEALEGVRRTTGAGR